MYELTIVFAEKEDVEEFLENIRGSKTLSYQVSHLEFGGNLNLAEPL